MSCLSLAAHFLVSTFPGSVSGFLRGYLLRGLGLCPCRSLSFLQPSVFGEALLCVGTVTGILAISWKSNLFIYFQVVTTEQTAAHWHAVAKLASKSLNILNPTFVLFHITNKLISTGHQLYSVWWILYICKLKYGKLLALVQFVAAKVVTNSLIVLPEVSGQ